MNAATRMGRRDLRLSLAGVLLMVAAGCSTLEPHYERPALPVAPAVGDAGAAVPATAPVPVPDIEWQRFYVDEPMRRLIDIALRNNRDLRIAALNIEAARAQYQVQRADRLPTLNAVASATRQPGANGDMTSSYSVGLGVTSYELDFFGRVKSLSGAALAQYFATEEARKAAQISLIASVATAELGRRADDALIELARSTLAGREDSLKLTRLRFDNGAASELDVRLAETLVETARIAQEQAAVQRQRDTNALTLLLGEPIPADLASSPSLDAQALSADLPAGLPSEMLTRRPDIRQAEQLLLAANANVGAARAALFPRITLTGSAGIASSDLGALFNNGSFAWTFMPQLVWPLFDSGRGQANVTVAQTNLQVAVSQYERAIQSAFREAADALAANASFQRQLQAQQALERAERERFRLSDMRYRNGVASYLDLLDAQRSLFTAQQGVVQTRLAQLQNQVALYKVLGGGWKEPPP